MFESLIYYLACKRKIINTKKEINKELIKLTDLADKKIIDVYYANCKNKKYKTTKDISDNDLILARTISDKIWERIPSRLSVITINGNKHAIRDYNAYSLPIQVKAKKSSKECRIARKLFKMLKTLCYVDNIDLCCVSVDYDYGNRGCVYFNCSNIFKIIAMKRLLIGWYSFNKRKKFSLE